VIFLWKLYIIKKLDKSDEADDDVYILDVKRHAIKKAYWNRLIDNEKN
jgi:hypothetical protein